MSITRKDIKAILPDIEDDALSKLLSRIHEETDTLRDEKEEAEKQLAKAREDLAAESTAKATAEKALDDYKAEQGIKETKSKKEAAYSGLLREANVAEKYIPLILKATDLSGYALGEDGKFTDSGKLSEAIKTEHADFIMKKSTSGADVDHPPVGQSGKKYASREEIMGIKDTTERQKAIAENHELFGI